MNANTIRSLFLNFFQQKNHTLVESSSLVPQNDPSLLFTNSGMVQFKDVFLGKEKRPYTRATTVQKCVRAGGKHNDLENVGLTARHHTFFEMLGNFSFGDYFKEQAIAYAWEFVTQKLQLPLETLYVTVFEKDEEAEQLWHLQQKVPLDRIIRMGEADNFWAMGETGPCGPCSEIYVDRGESLGCKQPTCRVGCSCDRFIEIWNLVFMQYNRTADGQLLPLPKPSVDTGAGLERLASVLQKVPTNYDTDVFQETMVRIAQLAGVSIQDPTFVTSLRVIADHVRAATFLIADGVLPSPEGRGYVLRRILRRAIRHGKKLGFSQRPFLHEVSAFVMEQLSPVYSDLSEKAPFIQRVLFSEEEQFLKTLEKGLSLLEDEMLRCRTQSSQLLKGSVAFELYDTYGFPLDLTRVVCSENQFEVDEVGFEEEMRQQKERSRQHWKGSGEVEQEKVYFDLVEELRSQGKGFPFFVREEPGLSLSSHCLALVHPKTFIRLTEVNSGEVWAIFDQTLFYPEGGGQIADQGWVHSDSLKAEVQDVQRPLPEIIAVRLAIRSGKLVVGRSYSQEGNRLKRLQASRNHTATHLLHGVLRNLLGKHVKQAGSLVTPEFLRLDFSHFQPLTEEECLKIENAVNEKIWEDLKVLQREMPKEEALALGAMAFFGEKYPDRVRVIEVGEFSIELCGGTHVQRSSEIHLFKIASETSVAAGVRRVVAYTSQAAFEYLRKKEQDLRQIQNRLEVSSSQEIFPQLEKHLENEKNLKLQWDQVQAQRFQEEAERLLGQGEPLGEGSQGMTFFSALFDWDVDKAKKLRTCIERMKQQNPRAVLLLGMKRSQPAEAFLIAGVGAQVPASIKASVLIQTLAPLIQGKGGGKPDLAQAGGTHPQGLSQALKEGKAWIQAQL